MLLIFGFRLRFRDVSHHTFACPGCGADRQGILQEARRWFALFFIPIIPMGVVGRQVRCTTCNRTFRPDVLDHPTAATLHDVVANAVRAIVVLLVGAGDRTDERLRAAAVSTVARVVPSYDLATLDSDLGHLHPAQAPAYVEPLAAELDLVARERMLTDLAAVAAAGSPITPAQRELLATVGQALGLTPPHVAGVIASVEGAQP
ncbi:MAG: hypothetical protein U0P45_15325 [Acidimicrobiales bacterium]